MTFFEWAALVGAAAWLPESGPVTEVYEAPHANVVSCTEWADPLTPSQTVVPEFKCRLGIPRRGSRLTNARY
jgi:hypothetical protein